MNSSIEEIIMITWHPKSRHQRNGLCPFGPAANPPGRFSNGARNGSRGEGKDVVGKQIHPASGTATTVTP
jgi:hypothetical protein